MQAPITLSQIEARAKAYSEARDRLRELCADLDAGLKALQRDRLPGIRRALNRATEIEAQLRALVEMAPDLFARPKTVILHGIRLGFMKGNGGIVWDDADAVVAAIQKHLPDQAETLIRWAGKPIKEAINQLDVATLRKIGCRVVDTGEEVFVKAVGSALDKMVDALIKAATEEAKS